MKRIGILTSGGDAPGMNAHVRAAVRTALKHNLEVFGIQNGFRGLLEPNLRMMVRADTANILARGGTILKTARCMEFYEAEGRARAARTLQDYGIEGLICCGGDGTFHGADLLNREHGIRVIGTPGTIDNDLYGTDFTIGFDTAINTAAEAIDRIRETAESHGRLFFIEVMGRHAGFIAMNVGIACGAEFIAVPETITNLDVLHERILAQGLQKRTIVVVGEGDDAGSAMEIAARVKELYNLDSHVTILGHIQRGGSPSVRDRVLAGRLGSAAVEALLEGRSNVMAGELRGELSYTPLPETWQCPKPIPAYLQHLADLLV